MRFSLPLLLAVIAVCDALQLVQPLATRPALLARGAMRTRGVAVMEAEATEGKLTWNTAEDADGVTYYWNAAGATQYEKPADFDPATAKNSGKYTQATQALYDDEIVDEAITYTDGTKKPEISNAMRDRLINESRGLGADPNAKNPFLYAFGAVGVFVCLGALAINM